MSGTKGQARVHEDARHFCDKCGQEGWRTNPVREVPRTGIYMHTGCKTALLKQEAERLRRPIDTVEARRVFERWSLDHPQE